MTQGTRGRARSDINFVQTPCPPSPLSPSPINIRGASYPNRIGVADRLLKVKADGAMVAPQVCRRASLKGWCRQPDGVFVQALKVGVCGEEAVVIASEYPRPTLLQLNQRRGNGVRSLHLVEVCFGTDDELAVVWNFWL